MKTDKKLKIKTMYAEDVWAEYDVSNLFGFERLKVINQELEAKLLTIKTSSFPPFPAMTYTHGIADYEGFEIANNGDLIMYAHYNGTEGNFDTIAPFVEGIFTGGGYGVLNVTGQAVANGFTAKNHARQADVYEGGNHGRAQSRT